MIKAELPDGTALVFPDDTPDAVIDAKVRAYMASGQATEVLSVLQKELRALNATIARVGAELVAAELAPRKLTRDWKGAPVGTEVVKG
ncbi:MAG: hypothetical protein ACK52I_17015 [Pseudomonadota bacterium]